MARPRGARVRACSDRSRSPCRPPRCLLADARLHLLVHLDERLLQRLALGRRGRVDLGLARSLHLGQGVLVLLLGDLVGVVGGLLHRLLELAALVGGQAVPELLVGDDRVAEVAVVGQREVLLHLVHLLRVEVGDRVLGAVDDAGLQRLVDLGESHHLRQRAQRAHLRLQHLGRLDAHLQALEVLGHLQRLVGAEGLEAVVPVGQAADALGLQLGQQRLAGRAGGDLVQVFVAVEDVGQVEDLELAHADGAELGQRGRQQLHRAELQRLHLLLVLVERGVGVDLDLHLAAGEFARALGEELRTLALGRVVRDDVAELDDERRLRAHEGDESEASVAALAATTVRRFMDTVVFSCGGWGSRGPGKADRRRLSAAAATDASCGFPQGRCRWCRARARC